MELQHQVEKKMFYPITGNVISIGKQSTEGKSHNGGLIFGEIVKDVMVVQLYLSLRLISN